MSLLLSFTLVAAARWAYTFQSFLRIVMIGLLVSVFIFAKDEFNRQRPVAREEESPMMSLHPQLEIVPH